MKSIFEIFDSKAIAAYWTDVNTAMKNPMIGSQFFPNNKNNGLELAWIKGRNQLPVALQPSAFDTKATLRDRIGVTEVSTEMPFFREATRIGEKERQDKRVHAAQVRLEKAQQNHLIQRGKTALAVRVEEREQLKNSMLNLKVST